MDLCWIDGSYGFYVIDVGTKYSAASFMSIGKEVIKTDHICQALRTCQTLVYSGMMDNVFCDKGSALMSNKSKKVSEENRASLVSQWHHSS